MHENETVSPSASVVVSVSVTVPPASSVYAPALFPPAIDGSSFVFATVTVAARDRDAESSPPLSVPPSSSRVVMVITRLFAVVGASASFLYAKASTRVSSSTSVNSSPPSAVQVTVAVDPSIVTTAAPALVAVFATQVAAPVMSQSEPSMTKNSLLVSATLVIVTTISEYPSVTCESPSSASAELNRTRLLSSSVYVLVTPVAERVGSSFTAVSVIV